MSWIKELKIYLVLMLISSFFAFITHWLVNAPDWSYFLFVVGYFVLISTPMLIGAVKE